MARTMFVEEASPTFPHMRISLEYPHSRGTAIVQNCS